MWETLVIDLPDKHGTEIKSVPPPRADGYFKYIGEAVNLRGHPDSPGHLFFAPANDAQLPDDVSQAHTAYEETAEVLRRLYQGKNSTTFDRYFRELVAAAQLLIGERPKTWAAAQTLSRMQERLVTYEGRKIRNAYVAQLAKLAFPAAIFFAALSYLPFHYQHWAGMNCLLAMSAATASIWLSFAIRKSPLSIRDLANPEGDLLPPFYRILFVNVSTLLLALLCWKDVAGVSIGSFSTNNFSKDWADAMIFGAAAGFSEKLITSAVAPHLGRILNGLGQERQQ